MNHINDKLHLRHPEITIPKNDPFKNDLLNREEKVKILTYLIESTTGPRVISVDAEWGNGKTVFLKMWAKYLRSKKHLVVEFNAWETDFCVHPFIVLLSELEIALNKTINNFDEDSLVREEYENIFKDIRSAVSKWKINSFGVGGFNVGFESNSDSAIEKYVNEYQNEIKSLKKFKQELKKTASKLCELDRSLVIVIDELDRCRPSYALELLEIAKHIFGVKDIVFILGINRSELEHSIKALYGSKFNAQEYTRKYFDINYKLPSPSRDDFINNLISNINIQKYFNSNNDLSVVGDFNTIKQMLNIFFADPSISLRTIEQTIQQLGLVYALFRKDRNTYMPMAVVMLILKTIDSKIYDDFVAGNISDLELVEMLPDVRRNNHSRENMINRFEAFIIVVAMYINLPTQNEPKKTPLFEHYENNSKNQYHPRKVIEIVEIINSHHFDWRGITNVIQRIEFVSEELLPNEEL